MDKKVEEDPNKKDEAPKNSDQDIQTHKYLLSIANILEVERVSLAAFLSQVIKSMQRAIDKKLGEHDVTAKMLTVSRSTY